MAYFDRFGVKYSDDKRRLLRCPTNFKGKYQIPDGVTSIAMQAFLDCKYLTDVDIPQSVTEIDSSAFAGCDILPIEDGIRYAGTYLIDTVDKNQSMYKIKWGTRWIGMGAFAGCSNLSNMIIPFTVTIIQGYAFDGCSKLESISIPKHTRFEGVNIFRGCEALPIEDNIKYADTYLVEAIDKSQSTYKIKESTTWIGSEAFKRCNKIKSIDLPETLLGIDTEAFTGCIFPAINIPNSVTTIRSRAFYNSALKQVSFGRSLQEIGWEGFRYCMFKEISIPQNLVNFNPLEFERFCLEKISVHIFNSKYDSREDCNAIIETATNELLLAANDGNPFKIPSSIRTIHENALMGQKVIIAQWTKDVPTCDYLIADPDTTILRIPECAVNEYRNKLPWCNFKNVETY